MKNNILLWGLISFFFVIGFTLPFISSEFGGNSTSVDAQEVGDDLINEDVGVTDVLKSLLLIVFWSFDVPSWFNLIFFTPLRLLLYVIVYDKIRGI